VWWGPVWYSQTSSLEKLRPVLLHSLHREITFSKTQIGNDFFLVLSATNTILPQNFALVSAMTSLFEHTAISSPTR
jgi:hypothetical protein